jgi:hypothetical protein
MHAEEQPYELLVRWKDGNIAGVAKRTLLVVTKDDGSRDEVEGAAQPVSEEDVPGMFPHADLVAQVSRLLVERDGLAQNLDEANRECRRAQIAEAEAVQRAEALEARLAEAKPRRKARRAS